MKQLLKERFQQLAGIKPLYEAEGEMSSEAKKWDVELSLSKAEVKVLSPKEYQERVDKKMEILKGLNKKGAFKKDWSEDAFEEWIADNYLWKKVEKQFKNKK